MKNHKRVLYALVALSVVTASIPFNAFAQNEELDRLFDDEELEDHRAKLAEMDSLDEIKDYCESLGEDNVFCSGYRESSKYSGSFLSYTAAAEHLRLNSHHYHRDAIVYCTHAWRNPELETLLSIVENFGDVEYFSQKKTGA